MKSEKKLLLIMMAVIMVSGLLTGNVCAATVSPNPEGKEIPALAAGDYMPSNAGIITAVYGKLEVNYGEVKWVKEGGEVTANLKDALIGINSGYVYGNQGEIDENNSELDFNEGVVNENREKGIINENYKTVKENWGVVKTNFYNGIINQNTSIGTLQKNIGQVTYNDGTINENAQSGRVTYNRTGAKIWVNNQVVYNNYGYIYKNNGSVTTNTGTVYNYSGTVHTNTGTVYQRVQVASLPTEVKNIDFVSGFYNYGSDRYFKQNDTGKIKITVEDGYSISKCYMTYGTVNKSSDGEYTVSNVTAPTTLYVETEKKAQESGSTPSGGGEETAASETPAPSSKTPASTPGTVITPETSASLSGVENTILSLPDDEDPSWTSFSLLQAKGVPKSKTAITLTWKKVKGATGYVIYGNKCGRKNRYEKITTVTGRKWIHTKRKGGTYYKYIITAINGDRVLAVSKTIHVATKGGKVGNTKKVTLNKSKVTLRLDKAKKKTFKAAAKYKNGALKVENHRKVAWESDNIAVAKVNRKGKITAVGKGVCYVYAYAQNGEKARIKVTVKP